MSERCKIIWLIIMNNVRSLHVLFLIFFRLHFEGKDDCLSSENDVLWTVAHTGFFSRGGDSYSSPPVCATVMDETIEFVTLVQYFQNN